MVAAFMCHGPWKCFSDAKEKAYRLVNKVKWDGIFYRNDIGDRALKYFS